jgi:hypothetical protein
MQALLLNNFISAKLSICPDLASNTYLRACILSLPVHEFLLQWSHCSIFLGPSYLEILKLHLETPDSFPLICLILFIVRALFNAIVLYFTFIPLLNSIFYKFSLFSLLLLNLLNFFKLLLLKHLKQDSIIILFIY